MNTLSNLGCQKGDVIKVEFKSIEDLVAEYKMGLSCIFDRLSLDDHTQALLAKRGLFLVKESYREYGSHIDGGYVTVWDPKSSNDPEFEIYNSIISSVEIVQAANHFTCSSLDISVTRIEDDLFINGQLVRTTEPKSELKSLSGITPYEDDHSKLLDILENYIADMSVKRALQGD